MTRTHSMTVNLDGLGKIRKELGKDYVAKIGILASGKPQGDHPGISNVELGIIHEFGNDDIPARSFLRMPIMERAQMLVKFLGLKHMRTLFEQGKIAEVFEQLAFKAEEVVDSAFISQGYGKWAANAPETIRRKGSSSPLVNFGQLRAAVTSEVALKKEL